MSATVETNTASWRKRPREDDSVAQREMKVPRYYYRLESESSKASEEDTESICSLQDRETDVVRDTTDTDSKSGLSDQDEYEVHYEEYEVASLSESDNGFGQSNSSSGSEDMMLAAAAAAICDSSLETWITDCEESDNSSLDDMSFGKTDFSTCIQCKSENDNPLYRYCEKCFQDRKKYYPPRPKRNKKSRNNSKKKSDRHVKLATLRSCLNGLSQDSGIGSSQECPPLDLDQIVVPDEHLTPAVDVCKNKWTLLRSYYKRALQRRKTKSGQSAKNIKKWRFESKMESLKLYQQGRGNHPNLQCSQNALGDEDMQNDKEEHQCDYHERMVEADDTDPIPSMPSPALLLEARPSSSKEFTAFRPRMEEAARPLHSSSNTSSRSLKRKSQDERDNLSDALYNFIKFKRSQSSQKVVNEPVISAKKRKLLTFFDDVAETILSFPEAEQAEIKRNIFNVVNNKQIELLRRAREPVL